MPKILSIDWDYFIQLSEHERVRLMPDGDCTSFNDKIRGIVWASHYAEGELDKIGVRQMEYDYVMRYISKHRCVPFMIDESHLAVLDFLDKYYPGKVDIVNIDFHHDMYNTSGRNAGNWVSHLFINNRIKSFTWIGSKNSQHLGMKKHEHYFTSDINYLKNRKFDAIFICRSDMWSPPHLDNLFMDMISEMFAQHKIKHLCKNLFKDRMIYIRELAKQMKEQTDKLKEGLNNGKETKSASG